MNSKENLGILSNKYNQRNRNLNEVYCNTFHIIKKYEGERTVHFLKNKVL